LKPKDLVSIGNEDAKLLGSLESLRRGYNNQLIRYHSQYSQLVGNFHTNKDLVSKVIKGLPEEQNLSDLDAKIY
jgi:hypothetical protein